MKPLTANLPRFQRLNGWANRLLRVDLSNGRIWAQETPYLPTYLGARGLAVRLCWDEYPEPVDPLSPENPLMIMTGALTGSRSPYSGRATVHAFSPQAYPFPWFTRSSIGGRFGGELKRAGYDGMVVTGASETPVQLRIQDDQVSLLPADELWGLDIIDTLDALEAAEGRGVRALTIGPAGERLSSIATIQSGSSSAAGQGGFGAVMGSKRLKAITVVGTSRVSLAEPSIITAMSRTLARMFKEAGDTGPAGFGGDLVKLNQELAAAGDGRARVQACTESCLTPCAVHFEGMPGEVYPRKWSGLWFCIGPFTLGKKLLPSMAHHIFDWELGRRAAFEMNVLSNRYGLNQFDLLMGLVPWLVACQRDGLITELNGQAMDWNSPVFWADFLRATAYREGLGDVLAQGGWAAARTLGVGQEAARFFYPGWGHTGHWDGHLASGPPFPHWLVSALQWMADTRDPFGSGHGSLWPAEANEAAHKLETEAERQAALDKARAIGERLYGSAEAVDPLSGYEGKASMGFYHTVRPVILDCVPVDDWRFPLIHNSHLEDHYWRLQVDGLGEIEGPSYEYNLFRAGTGVDWSEPEFNRAAERVCTLERAIQVRHWGRDRSTDEMLIPYFEEQDAIQSPYLERHYSLDREGFKPVLDAFYRLHGWDEDGRPTKERLEELGLLDIHQPMMEDAV